MLNLGDWSVVGQDDEKTTMKHVAGMTVYLYKMSYDRLSYKDMVWVISNLLTSAEQQRKTEIATTLADEVLRLNASKP
jgi:hypothetical protein